VRHDPFMLARAGRRLRVCDQPLRTASPSSVSPVRILRIQYDQVREFLGAGAPLPGPDDFEQAYASAKSTIPPPPRLARTRWRSPNRR